MNERIKKLIRLVKGREEKPIEWPVEAEQEFIEIMDLVLYKKKLTMTSVDRVWAAISAAKYVVENDIKGDLVECGVWRGGCSLAMAMTLKKLKSNKKVYLFDTFKGMTEPKDIDRVTASGEAAMKEFEVNKEDDYNNWCYASLKDVRNNFEVNGCGDMAIMIEGDVLNTLSDTNNIPSEIAVLRLDTDWYESTMMEMNVLYPILNTGGVLLIDDYGHWDGSRKAVEEYFKKVKRRPLLWKTDYTGRGCIKP